MVCFPEKLRQLKNFSRTLSLLLCATVLATSCKPADDSGRRRDRSNESLEEKESKVYLTPVSAIALERTDVKSTVATTGDVVPVRSSLLRTEEAGRLMFAQRWTEGDFVEKGTVIATVQSDTLESEIQNARAEVALQEQNVAIGRKSMESSVQEYQTIQDLYSRGIAPLKDVDSAKLSRDRTVNSHRQNLINLEKAKASLQSKLDRLERIEVVAPFSGLIVSRNTLEGSKPFSASFGTETITDYNDRMVSSDLAICGVIDTSQVYLRCDVTSREIDLIRPGQTALAKVYAREDIEVEGEVVDISSSVSQDTRAFKVDILVENKERTLKPGMFARVDIVTEVHQETISIPKEIITRRNNRDVVYVAVPGEEVEYHIAKEVPLEFGLEGKDEIEVTWGLNEGDLLVVRGYDVLQDRTALEVLRLDQPNVMKEEVDEEEEEEASGENEETIKAEASTPGKTT